MMMAVTTMVLTACSAVDEQLAEEEAVVESQAVSFSAYMNRGTTRADSPTPETEKLRKSGFGVFGFYTDGRTYRATDLPNFMYNQKVEWDVTNEVWTYSPVKYWPNETGSTAVSEDIDYLSFFAYAPYTEVSASTGCITSDSKGITGLSMAKEAGDPIVHYCASFDPSKVVDLCWATVEEGKTLNLTKPDINGKVTFTFKHALASLNVQIDADVDDVRDSEHDHEKVVDEYTRIYVRSVTFEGFAEKGQINLYGTPEAPPQWFDQDCDCDLSSQPITLCDGRRDGREGAAASLNERNSWLNPELVQIDNYTVSEPWDNETYSQKPGVINTPQNLFNVSGVSGTDEEKRAAPIYVIPTNSPMRVTIVYDVETYDPKLISEYLSDGKTHGSSIENNISSYITTGTAPSLTDLVLEAGKAYTINLHLGMTSVKMEAEVEEWPTLVPPGGEIVPVELPNNLP